MSKKTPKVKKLKSHIVSSKKKKRKFAKLQEMVPLNLKQEKENFFDNNFEYNPQFIYSFERLRFPVRDNR